MDEISTTAEAMRGRMNLLASEKEATKEDLESVKDKLQVEKDKVDKWSRLNDELCAQLGLAISERDDIGREYTTLKHRRSEMHSNKV